MDFGARSAIGHSSLAFQCPVSAQKMSCVLNVLHLPPNAVVCDVGCGTGELLSMLAANFEGLVGSGLESNSDFLSKAQQKRVHQPSLSFSNEKIDELGYPPNSLDLLSCIGQTHTLGGLRSCCQIAKTLVKPNGLFLVGEAFWKRAPPQSYLSYFGLSADFYQTHAGNVTLCESEGWTLLYTITANEDEWDHYEGMYLANLERYALLNQASEDALATVKRQRTWYRQYITTGRDTLGFGLYVFLNTTVGGE